MRDEKEERKKQARSNKQTRQSNTAHPRQSLFLEKMSCHVRVYTCSRGHQAIRHRSPQVLAVFTWEVWSASAALSLAAEFDSAVVPASVSASSLATASLVKILPILLCGEEYNYRDGVAFGVHNRCIYKAFRCIHLHTTCQFPKQIFFYNNSRVSFIFDYLALSFIFDYNSVNLIRLIKHEETLHTVNYLLDCKPIHGTM